MKHSKDTCFKLHGYPEWWHKLKAKKKREERASENSGLAAFVNTEPQLSLIPQEDSTLAAANKSMALDDSVGTRLMHDDIQGDLVRTKLEAPMEPMMITMGREEGNYDVETRNDDETMIKQEKPTTYILVPSDHSLENTPEEQSLNSSPSNPIDDYIGYRLPFRDNHGKPPNRYSLDHGEKKSKYPIANHVST
ncbi:hypothetical protein LWI29_001118 [Acer saccharum]|uniref:Uncharacterized protein n=1 Tax=Acer saccharum TaxID=4024 RepID=A0AA39VK97_ACESA|nr:hypothetical protein LWI29_001118 [Acer saccharum]